MHRTPGFAATVKELFSRRTTRGAASRRRGTSRNGDQRVETLEPRLALAVAAFFEPTSATLLASPGSDLYLTKVVGDELWVGESSTFVGRQTIPAISTLGTLAITTGVEKTDTDVEFEGFPMSSANTTTFVLSKTRLMDNRNGGAVNTSYEGGELYGTLTCVQPDGTTSTWTFTNWDLNTADPAYNLSLIRFTSGPGYGGPRTRFAPGGEPTSFVQPRTGYYVPRTIELTNNTGDIGQAAASLQIRWNQPLTDQQQATIAEVRYERATAVVFGENVNSTPQTDRDLLPSAPQRNAVFNLPAAAEVGSLGIVPGTLTGTIAVDGVPLDFTTRRASDQLYFTGGPSPTRGVLTTADGSRLYVTGRYESAGRISLTFESGRVDQVVSIGPGAPQSTLTLFPQDPGRVLISANYGVRTTGPKAGDVTFFAGHDLTNPIAVDVLTPGSTVHVDSPLLSSGEIAINATNVRFEGTTTTPGVLRVNAPNVSTAANIQTAQALAEISDGKVVRLIPVAGFEGSGYDADKPPTVTIGAPQSVRAEAALGRVNGSVVSINLNEQGSGYVTAPAITITPPDQPGGVQAVAEADVAAGKITGIRVTTPGSGYSFTPTITIAAPPPAGPTAPQPVAAVASAVIAGAILSIAVPNGGFGYQTAPAVTITSSAGGTGAVATATLTHGVVTSITVTNGGTGYRFDSTTEISIAAPPPSTGETAKAKAEVDPLTGRITGYTVTTQGSGYGAVPSVTVAAPIAATAARATATVNLDGTVSLGVMAQGYGYRTPPRVTIDPPTLGTGGRAARATAVLDNEGRVLDFTIVDPGSGYDPAKPPQVFIADPNPIAIAETATFNTNVAADEYRLSLADDPNTDPRRGRMFVSQTSSLSRSSTAAAALLRVEAEQSDVIVEGRINATAQTYYLPSPPAAADLAPFTFTTRASSGLQTGLISGGDVQVILANDLPTPEDDTAVAFNVVDLKTDIGSLRLRAATRAGATRRDPFPYSITIDEASNLDVDAVAASSFPIMMLVAGSLNFNAALSTAGGMDLTVGNDLSLGAPLQSTKGRISFEADSLLLNNSIAVTATDKDETKDDILLTARSGDIFVKDSISAVNRVRMNQRNRSNPQQAIRRYTGSPIAIPDGNTAVASIDLTDAINDFTFEKLQVGLSITHTWNSDLTATLISPAGARITLFSGVGGSSDSFKDTVLDNEAPVPIWQGTAPFTGTFRPQESLAGLFGNNAQGIWKLEVRDSGGGDIGTLDAFSLIFRNSAAQEGKVFGTGRVEALSLDILAEGSVGNPDKTPIDSDFFLRTEVDELTARVAKSVAIDELTRLNIPALVAGGHVTVRASGFDGDATSTGDAQVAALEGTFLDIAGIDVTAPNGSIDVQVITPNDLTIGNAGVIRLDKALSMTAAGSSKIRASGGSNASSITVLDAPLAGSGARQVRGAMSDPVVGTYIAGIPGTFASTISVSGSFTVPGVTDLRVGDRILIAGGASPAGAPVLTANGVYAVTSRSVASTVLTRATDSDTAAEMPNNTYVRVSGGSAVNKIYKLSYDAPQAFTTTPITVADVTSSLERDIGSDDPNDLVSFVVSTDEGTNLAVGSLGKMLSLAATNRFDQKTELRFSADVGTIPLAEELPTIDRKIDIDGGRRYGTATNVPTILIDGSKVGRRFDGSVVNSTTAVPGIQFSAGSAGSRLANLAIGGFANDAAVSIGNTSEILVDSVTLGKSPTGAKLGNKFGVVAKAGSSSITVSNATIVSSGEAAVRAEGDATGMVLVGNTIGQNLFDNKKGVEFASSGVNHIGAVALTNTPGFVVQGSPTVTMPAGFQFENLFIGQIVTGTGLPADTRIVAFDASQRTISLSKPALAGGAEMALSFSSPSRNTLQWNLYGARLASGTNRVVNSNVVNNVFAGIHIEGGTNTVGHTATRTTQSNDINLNQGWGILVEAASKTAAETLAGNQTIRGTFFTPQGTPIGDVTKQNRRGAVGIKAADITTNPLKDQVYPGADNNLTANPLTGVDPSGNLHFAVADTRGPVAALEPVLNAGGTSLLDENAAPDIALIRFAAAQEAKRFAIRISDDGSGIKRDTIVKEAFTITREGVLLVEGRDYTFRFDGNEIAQFEANATAFPLGNYLVTANSRKAVAGGQSGWLTDLDNNAMASSASFTISLADLPGKPTAVVAAAGDGRATVTWTAPTSVPAATDYIIEYRVAGGEWTAFADGTSAATSATVTGLANNVAHEFRVRAVNSAGQGEFSDASAPVTPRTPAAAPIIIGDTVGNAQATITWTTPADNGSPITGYVLEYFATGSATSTSSNLGVVTSHTVTGLVNGTSYSFRVAAVTGFGVGTFSSSRLIDLRPGAPGSTLAQPGNQSAFVSWPTPTPNGNLPITSYSVEMSANGGQSWAPAATTSSNSTTVTGLSNGVNYLFRVAATNRAGTGPVSPLGNVTPRTMAAAPFITTATAGSQQVALSWTTPADNGTPIVRYVVDFSSDGGGSWTRRDVGAASAATITGLANGTSYVFRVAAVNEVGVGALSAPTGQVIPLGAPHDVFASASNRSAWLIWTAADAGDGSTVTAYRIEMSIDGGSTWSQAATVASNANSARIAGLVNGMGYSFRIAAVANQLPGPFSELSNEVFPAANLGAPTRVTATLRNGTVNLRWTAPRTPRGVRIDDYALQYSTDNGVSWRIYEDGISNATRAVITGLPNGARYQFRVAAVTGDLIGEVSAATRPILLLDRRATLAAPTNLQGTASGSIYSLQWDAVAGNAGGPVTDYVIQYRVNSTRSSRWVTFRDPVAAATSATLTRLTNRTGYVFRVAARNLAGIGAYSSEFTIQ